MITELLLLTNATVPLHTATDGMERSSFDLISALANESRLRVCVIAHPKSILPNNIDLIGATAEGCPDEYLLSSSTPEIASNKWGHISNDAAILAAFLGARWKGAVHDTSSGVSACIAATEGRLPVVKTVRLMPEHPSASLTACFRRWTIHISQFQQDLDRWSERTRSTVIYDQSPITRIPITERAPYALSVGRVGVQKGHHLAAQVASDLGLPLKIIGRCDDAAYATEISRNANVELVGPLPHEVVIDEIRKAACLIWTPARPEPGGRVVAEALRVGTTVFARRVGLAADIIASQALEPALSLFAGSDIYRITALPDFLQLSAGAVARHHIAVYRGVAA